MRLTTPGETTRRSGTLPPDLDIPSISAAKGTFRKYPTEDSTNNTQHSTCYKKMNSRTRSASFSAVSSGVEEEKDPRRGRSSSVPLDPDHSESHQLIMHKIDFVKDISKETLDSSATPDLQLANTNSSRIAPLADPDQAVTHPEQVEPIEQGVPYDIDALSSSTEQYTCPILHTQAVTASSQPVLVLSVADSDLQPPITPSAAGEVTDPCLFSNQPETKPDHTEGDIPVAFDTTLNASQTCQLATESLQNQENREDQDEPQMALVPERFIAETMISPLLLLSPTIKAGDRLTSSTTVVSSIPEENRSDSFELPYRETINVPTIFITSPAISPVLALTARIALPVRHPSSCTEKEEEEQETVTGQVPETADPVSLREPSIVETRQLEDTIEAETEPQDQVGPTSEISSAAAITPFSHIVTADGDGPQKDEEYRIAVLPAPIPTSMPSLVQGGSRATSLDPEPRIVDERPITRRRAKSLESVKSSDVAIVPVFVQPVTRPSQPPESTDEEVVAAQPVVEHAPVISASAPTREGNRPRPRARQNKRKKTSRSQSQEPRYPRKRIKLIRSASFGVDQQAPIGILASIDDMRRDVDASGTKLKLSLGLGEASVVTTPPPAESQPKVSSSAITTASERDCPEIIEDVSFEEVQAMLTVMKRGKETGTKVETVEKHEPPQTPKKRPSSGLSQISVCPLPSCTL